MKEGFKPANNKGVPNIDEFLEKDKTYQNSGVFPISHIDLAKKRNISQRYSELKKELQQKVARGEISEQEKEEKLFNFSKKAMLYGAAREAAYEHQNKYFKDNIRGTTLDLSNNENTTYTTGLPALLNKSTAPAIDYDPRKLPTTISAKGGLPAVVQNNSTNNPNRNQGQSVDFSRGMPPAFRLPGEEKPTGEKSRNNNDIDKKTPKNNLTDNDSRFPTSLSGNATAKFARNFKDYYNIHYNTGYGSVNNPFKIDPNTYKKPKDNDVPDNKSSAFPTTLKGKATAKFAYDFGKNPYNINYKNNQNDNESQTSPSPTNNTPQPEKGQNTQPTQESSPATPKQALDIMSSKQAKTQAILKTFEKLGKQLPEKEALERVEKMSTAKKWLIYGAMAAITTGAVFTGAFAASGLVAMLGASSTFAKIAAFSIGKFGGLLLGRTASEKLFEDQTATIAAKQAGKKAYKTQEKYLAFKQREKDNKLSIMDRIRQSNSWLFKLIPKYKPLNQDEIDKLSQRTIKREKAKRSLLAVLATAIAGAYYHDSYSNYSNHTNTNNSVPQQPQIHNTNTPNQTPTAQNTISQASQSIAQPSTPHNTPNQPDQTLFEKMKKFFFGSSENNPTNQDLTTAQEQTSSTPDTIRDDSTENANLEETNKEIPNLTPEHKPDTPQQQPTSTHAPNKPPQHIIDKVYQTKAFPWDKRLPLGQTGVPGTELSTDHGMVKGVHKIDSLMHAPTLTEGIQDTFTKAAKLLRANIPKHDLNLIAEKITQGLGADGNIHTQATNKMFNGAQQVLQSIGLKDPDLIQKGKIYDLKGIFQNKDFMQSLVESIKQDPRFQNKKEVLRMLGFLYKNAG